MSKAGAFRDKTIWITGASQGIGRGLALYAAKQGARVALLARRADPLAETADMVRALGGDCFAQPCDLRDAAALAAWVQNTVDAGFAPDIVIHNAADTTSKPFLETSPDEIESIIQTNVTAVLLLSRLATPHLVHRNGALINLSSLAGYKCNPAQTVYSISKGALNAVSDGLRTELDPYGVRVINVALMGIGEGPGRYPLEKLAHRLALAVARGDREVFLYRSSAWLMWLYRVFPGLARHR